MTEWNFEMDEAPKGEYREIVARTMKDGTVVTRKVYDSVRLLAADPDSSMVTITNWIPEQERWNMFTKENPPVAWAPWPLHPLY